MSDDPNKARDEAADAQAFEKDTDERHSDEEWPTWKKWALGLGIIGLGVAGFVLLQVFQPTPPKQQPPPQTPLVTTVPAEIVENERIAVESFGTVRARTEVQLAPQVGGRVVYVAPSLVSGGAFRRGQTLVRIDPADYRNAVDRARAAVAQREVEVLQAEQQRQIAQEEIARFEQRAGIDVPAPETEAGALAARLPQVEAAQAALQSAQAQLNDAELQLARTTVTAPFDGRVRSKEVGEGGYVAPGQPLATVYPTDELEVPVSLSAREAALIPDLFTTESASGRTDIGARVLATFGGETYAWRGYLDRAESALDAQSRTVTAIVRVPDPYALGVTRLPDESPATGPSGRPPLLIDQYVTVEIEGRPFDRFVSLPREALRERGEPSVWTVEDDSILVEQPVEVIQTAGDRVFVRGDIAPGLPVVTNDLAVQTDGMTVRVAADSATVAPPTGAASRSGASADTTRANRASNGEGA